MVETRDLVTVRRAVLTGGTGFLGRRLLHRLRALDIEVVSLLRAESQSVGHEHALLIGSDEELVAAVGAVHPQAVIHVAAAGGVNSQTADFSAMIRANITLGALLMQACVDLEDCAFVGIGSFSQRTVTDGVVHPNSFYAATKDALESIAGFYCGAHDLEATFLYLTDVYGPGDDRRRLLDLLADAVRSGAALVATPGDQLLSFVHVDDVVDAILHCLAPDTRSQRPRRSAQRFGISGPELLTLRETVRLMEDELGVPIPVRWGGRPYRENEVMVPALLDRLPGWTPNHSVVDGFRALLKDAP